jgi:hypothetical protein
MHIEYDEAKRATTLHERGLDFADAARVLDGPTLVANSIAAPMMASREPSGWTSRGTGLDPSRQGSPHHLHEVGQ